MTTVSCDWDKCFYNKNGVCRKEIISLKAEFPDTKDFEEYLDCEDFDKGGMV